MADRITAKTLDNLARVLSINLGRPELPYVDGKAQIGCIHVGNNGYGYSIDCISNDSGGCRGLSNGMTASEAFEWLWAALVVCQEAGHDGPIAERWNGTFLRSSGKFSVSVKYIGRTEHKPSRWQAKDSDKLATVYTRFSDGPVKAAIRWAERAGISQQTPSHIIQLSPTLYAVEF